MRKTVSIGICTSFKISKYKTYKVSKSITQRADAFIDTTLFDYKDNYDEHVFTLKKGIIDMKEFKNFLEEQYILFKTRRQTDELLNKLIFADSFEELIQRVKLNKINELRYYNFKRSVFHNTPDQICCEGEMISFLQEEEDFIECYQQFFIYIENNIKSFSKYKKIASLIKVVLD